MKKKKKDKFAEENSKCKLMVTLAEMILALQHLHIGVHEEDFGYLGFYASIGYCKSEKPRETHDSEMRPGRFGGHKEIYALHLGINACFQRRTSQIYPSPWGLNQIQKISRLMKYFIMTFLPAECDGALHPSCLPLSLVVVFSLSLAYVI